MPHGDKGRFLVLIFKPPLSNLINDNIFLKIATVTLTLALERLNSNLSGCHIKDLCDIK